MRDIYLDFNASTPVAPEVAAIMRHALETGYGNPSSGHWAGVPARQMVEDARTQVADLICCAPQENLLPRFAGSPLSSTRGAC